MGAIFGAEPPLLDGTRTGTLSSQTGTSTRIASTITGLTYFHTTEEKAIEGCDIVLKMLLIGDNGVGKTSLSSSFIDGPNGVHTPWNDVTALQTGINFRTKTILIEDYKVKIVLWELNPTRFKSIMSVYYRGCCEVLVLFDPSNIESFHNVSTWMIQASEQTAEDTSVSIVCSKADLLFEDPWLIERLILISRKYPNARPASSCGGYDPGCIWSQLPLEIVLYVLMLNPVRAGWVPIHPKTKMVQQSEMEQFAMYTKRPLFFTSAKKGINVEETLKIRAVEALKRGGILNERRKTA